jgi:tight adherence protein B
MFLSFVTMLVIVSLLPSNFGTIVQCSALLWRILEKRRYARWSDSEVPSLLSDLAATARAGVNLRQGFSHVSSSRKWRGVCRDVLDEVLVSFDSGCSLSHVLQNKTFDRRDALAQRLGVCLRVLAVSASTGGNVVRLLESSAEGARGTVRLRQRAKALTAQMRLQATVVSLAPLCVVLVLEVLSPSSLRVFVSDPVGVGLGAIMACSNLAGVAFLWRIARSWGG